MQSISKTAGILNSRINCYAVLGDISDYEFKITIEIVWFNDIWPVKQTIRNSLWKELG